jgi:O-antigen/teichoic acid export membrane protein
MLLKNLASMGALNLFKSLVQFAMNLVLAGFISPSEYGLVVFTLPFITLISMLTDLGLSSTMVRQSTLTPQEAGSVLTMVLSAGTICAAALAVASFTIQSVANMTGLQPIMAGMSGIVVLSISATPIRALLERRLRFNLIAKIQGAAVAVSAALSVAAGMLGAGVWSLVLYNALLQTILLIGFAWCARSDFVLSWHWGAIGHILSFGGWVLAANLLSFAARNGDNILIGAWLGATDVGLYGLAYQFMLIPLSTISWPASSVLLATLSRYSGDAEQTKSIIKAVCSATAALSFPVMVYLTFGLQFPLHAFMPAQWHSIPAIVLWLAPLGALQSISAYNGVILLARGEARLQFWVSVCGSAITVATFVAALPFGLLVLVKAYAITGVFVATGFLAVAARKADISLQEIFSSIFPASLASFAGLAAVGVASEFHLERLQPWLVMSTLYASVVVIVYALMRKTLMQHWHQLVRVRTT